MSTILIVDDEQHNLQLLVSMLEEGEPHEPYLIRVAPNGVVAYQIAQEILPDLVITDWEMPQMDGISLLQTLKASPKLKHVPVLMVTGIHLGAEGLMKAFDCGAMDYLRKPVQQLELQARVRAALRLKAQQEEIAEQLRTIGEQKSRELSTKMLELQQKKNELQDLKQQLAHINTLVTGSAKDKLTNIIGQINLPHNEAEEWEAFRQQFEQVHPCFFTSITQRHPGLSKDDLKYCAFLRLHMGNQQIAQLLNIAYDSVRTHKYRLKKKLKLAADTDLNTYLLAF